MADTDPPADFPVGRLDPDDPRANAAQRAMLIASADQCLLNGRNWLRWADTAALAAVVARMVSLQASTDPALQVLGQMAFVGYARLLEHPDPTETTDG